MDDKNNIKDRIFGFAQCLIDTSNDKIKMAFQEEDDNKEKQIQAAHFLKLKGKRIGRDLELYNFMVEIKGTIRAVLPDLLAELLIPIKTDCPDSYKFGSDYLIEWGQEVYQSSIFEKFKQLF